ncbi:MAG: conjugal transfer protein TrbE, partial [Acetobacter sp.]|nr:conjugal transfer protein TrbE [Acetobacter sp.]
RSKQAGLADLLVYASVIEDGIVLGKDGSLSAAFKYTCQDNASATDEERNVLSGWINKTLVKLGNGWMIHVDAARHQAPNYPAATLSNFGDEVTAAIDQERREYFESHGVLYESFFVLVVTYLPPLLAEQKFVGLMFDDDSPKTTDAQRTALILENFKKEIDTIENNLSNSLKLRRLKGIKTQREDGSFEIRDEFLSWLNYCVTGNNSPIILPKNPIFLDALIGNVELWTGVTPRIGNYFIQAVAIDGLPFESTPGMLNGLAELSIEYRWSNRFIFLDGHTAVSHLEKFRKKWKQKVRGFMDQVMSNPNGHLDQDAMAMVQDASDAIAEVNSGSVSSGYYTSVIILMDKSKKAVEENARIAEKAINSLGFSARIETINTMEAFLGSLPAHAVENVRRPIISSMNMADLIPSSSVWTGSKNAPCPFYPPLAPALMSCVTTGCTPFWLNLHVRDLGHTFVFGPTGAGKSVLLATIAAQLRRYRGMTIFSFDKGMSMFGLCAAINGATKGKSGQHFNIAGDDSKLAFCPLQFLETDSDRSWAVNWIENIIALNNVSLSPTDRHAIATAINSMAQTKERTLTAFIASVQNQKIRDTLEQYDVQGIMGHLLGAEEDGLAFSDFNVFEIEELMGLDEKYALPVLSYLFRRIDKALQGQPAAIILDEAWLMLGHPLFREKIREWLKVLRKANCLVLLATQSLSDAANSGILDVLVESTATKIFLPNAHARSEETAELYKKMGLNSRQIEIIANAIPKKEYYCVSEEGRRLFNLALGRLALCFLAVSDKAAVQQIKELQKIHGYEWYRAWIAQHGLSPNNIFNKEVA